MIHLKDKIDVTPDQARFLLEQETAKFGVCIDLDRALEYQADLIEQYKPYLKPYRELGGSQDLSPTQNNDIIRILQTRFGIPQYKMINKQKLSVGKEVISGLVADPAISEDAREFLKLHQQLKICKYNISYLDQYIDLPILEEESIDNNRMVLARPTWHLLSTKRISAREPSLQNLASHFADIITVPKGYIPLFSDSGQIEPRITYSYYIKDPVLKQLIMMYGDAYFGQVHFALMSEEEMARGRENLDTLEIKPLSDSLRSDLKLISLVGNYGGDLENRGFDPSLVVGFRDRIQNHPERKLWEERVTEEVRNGADTFYAAFGNSITPEETIKYKKSDTPRWISHLIRCGINNPIQGTASELMCQSVYEATRIIREKAKGFTNIGYYKHDEGFFNVDERDAHLIDELAECLAYQVEGWIPIESDKTVGKKKPKPIKGLADLVVESEIQDMQMGIY